MAEEFKSEDLQWLMGSRTITRVAGRVKNPFQELDQSPAIQAFVQAAYDMMAQSETNVECVIVKFDDNKEEKFFLR